MKKYNVFNHKKKIQTQENIRARHKRWLNQCAESIILQHSNILTINKHYVDKIVSNCTGLLIFQQQMSGVMCWRSKG